MKYILLDTNSLICREGEKELDKTVQLLNRLLLDSQKFKLCIHPIALEELKGYKNDIERRVILSKVGVYKKIQDPPIVTNEFLKKCGKCGSLNLVNNETLLYMLERNCVSYLITNDTEILLISQKIGLRDRVFSILEAINFLSLEDQLVILKTPVIISERFLYTIDTSDHFFDSLRQDYNGFDNWIENKKRSQEKAYVSYMDNGGVGAFLMLKMENETEDYSELAIPFQKGKRIKISTFKVVDNGKSLGEAFIKIAVDFALKKNVTELYLTVFEKQQELIELISEFGFELYTYKMTTRQDKTRVKESVFLKKFNVSHTLYPIIHYFRQSVFVIPIKHEFSHMLFPDVFENHQISMNDLDGSSSYSNAIKKAYISQSRLTRIRPGDILIFYSSEIRKSLICIGVVDDVFRANEINNLETLVKIVKRRTVYQKDFLERAFKNGSLVILFKYFFDLPRNITLGESQKNGILNGPPQSIQRMSKENFKKLVDISGIKGQIEI